jgi:carbon monoxide dehydrogenase subunit G
MHDVEHLSIYIDRAPGDVYEYASDPRNLPRWASGLANSEVEQDGGDWIVEASFGKVKVKFAERNTFGVMDHDVTLGSGVTMHNPMRVVPHGDGSEFIFTLIRRAGMSDEEFAQDRASIQKDLKTLKTTLEGGSR